MNSSRTLTNHLIERAISAYLTPIDSAMILLAASVTPDAHFPQKKLVDRVTGPGATWITNDRLQTVALRLLALRRCIPTRINGEMMALLARRLITCESAVGGPYRDYDGALSMSANAALAQLFESYNYPLPAVHEWLAKHASGGGKYSRSSYGLWSLTWPTVIVPNLQRTKDVKLPAENSISSLAVAVCLESLSKPSCNKLLAADNVTGDTILAQLERYPDALRAPAVKLWGKITRVDTNHEVSGLSQYFYTSLASSGPQLAVAEILAAANFYTWMAYTVYDDFIDQDGDPADLPVANMMHRRAIELYGQSGATTLVQSCFDDMDAANAWELAHCRFNVTTGVITIMTLPDYGDLNVLARRAGAHILGPRIIAERVRLSRKDRTTVDDALAHYLIARQLNDDLHDWVDDLQVGHISPVVAHLLRKAGIAKGPQKLSGLIVRMKQLFWEGELDALCQVAEKNIQGTQVLVTNGILAIDSSFMVEIIAPIDYAIRQSRRVHSDSRRFMSTYARQAGV